MHAAADTGVRQYFSPLWSLTTLIRLRFGKTRPKDKSATILFFAALAGTVVVTWGLQSQTLQTGAAEWNTTVLEDGSSITQGPNTLLIVDITNTTREVRLVSGEALFTVTPNPNRPFRVTTNLGVVAVLGTRFCVKRYHDDPLLVTVVEGIVGVTPRNSSTPSASSPEVKLIADQQLIVTGDAPPKRRKVDAAAEVQWTKALVQFRDTTVGEIAHELNRRNRLQIQIKDRSIETLQVPYMNLRLDDPRAFVDMVIMGSDAEAHSNPETGNIELSASANKISVPNQLNPHGKQPR